MAYYKEKVETGNEYVIGAKKFYTYTLNKCMMLPQRWYEPILKPVIESARKTRDYTIKANKVYVELKNQKNEEVIEAIKDRDKYLYEALRELSVFDIAFDDLMSYIDIGKYERTRIKQKLEEIINKIKNEDKELNNIEINLSYKENELSFISAYGSNSIRLKLTPQNLDYWLNLESKTENNIKQRINKDKQLLINLNK